MKRKSAQKRRPYRSKRDAKTISIRFKKLFYLFAFAICVFVLLALTKGERWDKTSKFSLVVQKQNGDIAISTFDNTAGSITTLLVPGDTEVVSARNFGKFRIKSVYKLGKSEGIGGKLLAETVTRYFRFPTNHWSEDMGAELASGNLLNLFKGITSPYSSNLSMATKLQLAIFSLKVNENDRETIDLKDTSFLSSQTLKDGEMGYVTTSKVPNKILLLFTDAKISENQTTVSIIDHTGEFGLADEFGRVLETLGAKVAVIERQDEDDIDCTVSSENEYLSKKISDLFDCRTENGESNFDLVVAIGRSFAERY